MTLRLTVQAAFGASAPSVALDGWTDITEWVDIQSAGIGITRGASDELQQIQTGTCSLVLDNADGRFTPGNAASPYYPYVRRRLPIRVRITTLGGKNFVTNPSFETGSSGWWEAAGALPADLRADGTHVHSGTQALRIQWASTATGGIGQSEIDGLTLGTTYTASAYVYVPSGSPAVRLQIDGTTLGALSTVTDAYTRITVTWTATAASHKVQVTTGTTSPVFGTQVWVDDVQAETGATATTFDTVAAVVHDRFFGTVTSLPFGWKGLLSTVQITASDMLAWLSRDPALNPMLVEEVLLTGPAAYYPLGETEGSSGGDLSGNSRPALATVQTGTGGTLTFGQGTGPATDGLPTPLFTPASSTAGLYLTTDLGRPLTGAPGQSGDPGTMGTYVFEAWFSTTTKGRVIMAWQGSDPIAFDNSIVFTLDATSGALVIETRDGGNLTTTTVATPNLADGAVHHLVYEDRQGLLGGGQYAMADGTVYSIAISPQRDGLRNLTVGAYNNARLWSGTISHVAVYLDTGSTAIAQSKFTAHYQAGTTAFAGEAADARMGRLAAYAGLPLNSAGTFSAVAAQGELGSNVLTHMHDVEATESGKLFCDRGDTWLLFQSRTVRYNPVPAITLSWPDTETDSNQWADDDQKLINMVTASRPGGATQHVVNAASVTAYGPYEPSGSTTLLKTTDAQVIDAATWTVSRYADPPPELRQLAVEAYSMPAATYAALLQADISTIIAVTDLPPEAPSTAATVFVEGYEETITEGRHLINYRTSRADTDTVWVLNDPTYSVLGATTRLAY